MARLIIRDRWLWAGIALFVVVSLMAAGVSAWLVGGVLDLRDENDKANDATRQVVVDLCVAIDGIWPTIMRGALGIDPDDPDYRDNLTDEQRVTDDAVRDEFRRRYPQLENCAAHPPG